MPKILLLNGPNLNLLGSRETKTYGTQSLSDIESRLKQQAIGLGHALSAFQSNAEGALIDRIQAAKQENVEFILLNPGAYTHTSIAIRDALSGVEIPFIEVHISNIYQREAFRKHSYFSDIAEGTILGLGTLGYDLALTAAAAHLTNTPT